MSVTISVRVPRELKEELTKYGVEVSEVARRALQEEVERRRREELGEMARDLGEFLEKIPRGRVVEGIREDRGRLR
jgi:predicted transcriptional regulator